MSSQFLSLEEAAKKLGVSTDQLVSFRSEGRVRGFRDGASWKFPEGEIERLADDLAADGDSYDPYKMVDDDAPAESPSSGGSGVVLDDLDLDLISGTAGGSSLIGSDVNLVAGDGDGSDVQVVSAAGDDDFMIKDRRESLVEIDSGELQLSPDGPVITHDSEMIDLAIDAKTGSTGPIAKRDLDDSQARRTGDSGLSFDAGNDDSDDDLLGISDDVLGSGLGGGGPVKGGSALSSLELMDDLDISTGSYTGGSGLGSGLGSNDVLSELDLLSADAGGSGLISGDSGNVIGSGLGSDRGRGPGSSGKGGSSKGSGLILDDDDDLLITDDDELVLGGSDLSISGDSGINLMSPSDSGISLESEPLDLAGSSISALDLGLELGSGGSSGKGSGSASGVGAEDFQLSPSGISIDTDSDSSSQVIEVEDSAAFAGDGFGDALDGDDAFADSADQGGFADEEAMAVEDGFAEEESVTVGRGAPVAAYEVPYSIFQVVGLVCVVFVMGISGMLMSDLVRNIWTYSEPAAPVSGLTDMLIDISPFDK